LLNPDTVLLPETVRKMVEVCESEPSVGMVGTNLIETRFDGKYWKRGVVTVDRFCFPSPAEKNRLSFLAGGKAAESMYVSGAVLMIKAEALRKIGFFDDLYFSYSEDVDICWRARIAGYKVVVAMDATAYHLTKTGLVESDNSYSLNARRVYLREKNAIATMIKNYGLRNVFVYVGMYLHLLFVEILATRLLYPKVSEAMFSALVWNLKNLRNTLKNRGVVQRLRAVPDGDIVRFMNKDYYKLRLALALKLKATR
jgi:GT2 family glycosyltransferase